MNDKLLFLMLFCSSIGLFWIFVNQLISPIYDIKDLFLRRKIKKEGGEIFRLLKVTLVVPAWNESVGVKDTLKTIFANDFEKLEVIVVDDGSTDGTGEKVREFAKNEYKQKYSSEFRSLKLYTHKKNSGKGAALNTGIKAATGDVIFTVDGDSVFMPDTISNVVKYFVDPNIHAVEGNIKVSNHKNFIGLLQKIEYQMGCHYKRAFSVLGCEYVMPGAVAAFRKEVFDKVGLLDNVCKTEDLEFTFRVRKHGFNIYFAEDAVVWTEGASNLSGLLKQRLRWKKGRIDAMLFHRDMIFSSNNKLNKFLSHFILPFIIVSDFVSLMMPILSLISIYWLISTQDVYMLGAWIIINLISTMIPILFGYQNSNWKVVLFSPFFFLFYHVLSYIEAYALIKSIYLVIKGENVIWQDWQRKGVMNV